MTRARETMGRPCTVLRRHLLLGLGGLAIGPSGCASVGSAKASGASSPIGAGVPPTADVDRLGSTYQRFATGLLFTHDALRRNLDTITSIAGAGNDGSDAFLDYVDLFNAFLTGHHEGEDDFIYPALRKNSRLRTTDAAFLDARSREHREVHRMLQHLERATDTARRASPRALSEVHSLCVELGSALSPHLLSEEAVLTPGHLAEMIGADAMTVAQSKMLDRDKGAGSVLLMLYIHSLTDDEQQILLGQEAWFFRKVLIALIWRGGFAHFLPYAFNPHVAL